MGWEVASGVTLVIIALLLVARSLCAALGHRADLPYWAFGVIFRQRKGFWYGGKCNNQKARERTFAKVAKPDLSDMPK